MGEPAFLGRCVAVDSSLWLLVLSKVEGAEIWEEAHGSVGQVVMNPPRERSPVLRLFVAVEIPVDDNTGSCALIAVSIKAIPGVSCPIRCIAATIVLLLIPF